MSADLFRQSPLLVAILAMVTMGGLFYALAYPWLSGERKVEKRLATVAERKRVGRPGERVVDATQRRKQIADSLKDVEARERDRRSVNLDQKLQQAGLSIKKPQFFIISAVSGLVCAVLVLFFTGKPLWAPVGLLIGGLGLPQWAISFLKKRRLEKFIAELPNAMDIVVRGIRAGIPLGDCLRIIASESVEPLRSEFRTVVEEQTLGMTLTEAVERLAQRVPVTEANFFAIVINIQTKAGGNLSEALGNLSRVLRERKKMRSKVGAMSMEAKASAAIIGAMPILVVCLIYVVAPGYVALLFTTQAGNYAIAGGLGLMFCGIMVMRNMIRFDI
jgi:tight adherence protein B